jgi:hypothetical protein
MEVEEGEVIVNDNEIDIELRVCYHAIFGISDIKTESLAQLTKWPAFLAAHFEDGRRIRTLSDFADNWKYIHDAFVSHDFLHEYGEKFGHTAEYLAAHIVTSKAITALCCLEWAIRKQEWAISSDINRFMQWHGRPVAPTFRTTRALDDAMLNEILWYLDEVNKLGELDVAWVENVAYTFGDKSPREGKENEVPTLSHAYRDTGRYNPPSPEERSEPAPGSQTTTTRPYTVEPRLFPRVHLSVLLDELKALSNW